VLRSARFLRFVVTVALLLGGLAAQARDAAFARERGDRAVVPDKKDRIERHGITWRFDQPYVTGTFANGDPWVIGPVRIVEITPKCVEIDGRVLHGSMVDPDPSEMLQGYDSGMFGDEKRERYRDDKNVARGLSPAKPLRLVPVQSLMSVVSRPEAKALPTLQTAAVLTCVAEEPAPDAFRPPYCRGDKTTKHRVVDLDFRVLRRLQGSPGAPPFDVVAKGFERVWLDHFPEWPVRYAHPLDNMPDYGREIAALVGNGALLLNLDVPNQEKRELLVRMVQVGIDLHGCLRAGCRWPGLGGHGHGRKLPILLAGLVLHDQRMLAIGTEFAIGARPGPGKKSFFAEDTQTFFVAETAPGVWNHGHGGYTKEHDKLPEWGFEHVERPEADRASWTADSYRRCCTANGWVGQCLAARILGLVDAWNHPPYFAYMDRYMQMKPEEEWHRAWVPWQAAMWDRYRAKY